MIWFLNVHIIVSECWQQNDMQEDQNKLMETMVMNSKLEDANVRFEYQIEDYKDK